MNKTRTAVERLDALLAGLEEDVLRAGGAGRGNLEEVGSTEGVKTIRSDIEALIQPRTNRMVGRELGRSVRAHSSGAKVKVTEAMARLGRWVGVGPYAGDGTAAPRVRMAFSGAMPEKGEKAQRRDAGRRKRMPDKETEPGGG